MAKDIYNVALQDILFIDIETVPGAAALEEMPAALQEHWVQRMSNLKDTDGANADPARLFGDKAALHAAFGKIVCIGMGVLSQKEDGWKITLKALSGSDEKSLLNNFCSVLGKFNEKRRNLTFCGHNIKDFDLPYISRRMLVHGMALPSCLQHHGKKSWSVPHLDTMELWGFGDKNPFIKLDLLAAIFGIPTPKDDITGAQVGEVFWKDNNLERISTYCLKDVLTTAKVYMHMIGMYETHITPIYANEKLEA